MIPVHAVGGAAGAVGGIADSGLVVRLTRQRLWIGAIGILLGGIVALNVIGLSLSASTSGASSKIDELERSITVQRSRIAKRSSNERVQALAKLNGLGVPAPKAVKYLKSGPGDAALAAERLAAGEISILAALPIAPELAASAAVPPGQGLVVAAGLDPAATVPVDPAAPVVADPGAVAPAPVTPAPAQPPAPAAPAPAPAPAAATPTAPPASGAVSP